MRKLVKPSIFALTLLIAPLAYAVNYVAGDVLVTIALVGNYSDPGTFTRDDAGKPTKDASFDATWSVSDSNGNPVSDNSISAAKSVTYKYGNKELLDDLASGNSPLLPDGKAAGWVIYAIPGIVSSTSVGYTGIYARKKGQEDVDLTKLLSLGNGFGDSKGLPTNGGVLIDGSRVYSVTETTTYNPDSSVKSVAHKGTFNFDVPLQGQLISNQANLYFFEFYGLFTGAGTDFVYLADLTDKSSVTVLGIPGATKIAGIVGNHMNGESLPNSVSGSIGFGASKAVKLP